MRPFLPYSIGTMVPCPSPFVTVLISCIHALVVAQDGDCERLAGKARARTLPFRARPARGIHVLTCRLVINTDENARLVGRVRVGVNPPVDFQIAAVVLKPAPLLVPFRYRDSVVRAVIRRAQRVVRVECEVIN